MLLIRATSYIAILTLFAGLCTVFTKNVTNFGRFLEKNNLDILVVRRTDYTHYDEESIALHLNTLVALALHYVTGLWESQIRIDKQHFPIFSFNQVKGILLTSWSYIFIMETMACLSGTRQMDPVENARNKLFFVRFIIDQLLQCQYKFLANVFALSYQALLEGSLLSSQFFVYGFWLLLAVSGNATTLKNSLDESKSTSIHFKQASKRIVACLLLIYPIMFVVFRFFITFKYGWPKDIIYGSDENILGKRNMLSSLGFRIPHLLAMCHILLCHNNNPHKKYQRSIFINMGVVQTVMSFSVLYMMEFSGRAYVEKVGISEPVSFILRIFCTVYRSFETIMDSALVLFTLFRTTNWFDLYLDESSIVGKKRE